MSRLLLPFFFVVFACLSSQPGWCALQHNIAVSAITAPASGERVSTSFPVVISASAVNAGTSGQSNVKVVAVLRNAANTIVYTDTINIPNWTSNVILAMTFKSFTPQINGTYKVCIIANLATDQQRSDDTLCQTFLAAYRNDLRATAVTYPLSTDTLRAHSAFHVRGKFENIGIEDEYDRPLKVQIRRCSDNALVFEADSTIEELFLDSLPREFRFPGQDGIYDIRTLVPGCYRVAVIAMHPLDADRTNDTAYSTFTVIPNDNNISADSAIAPPPGSYVTALETLPVIVRFLNTGLNPQSNVTVTVAVRHNSGTVLMRDTVTIASWLAGEYRLIAFDSFTTTLRGMYTITAIAHLNTDEWRPDDTLRYNVFFNYQNDIRIVAITSPLQNEKRSLGVAFQPEATFIPELSVIKEFANIPATVIIRSCFDDAIVFQADSVIPYLHYDSGAATFRFPSKQGAYATATLPIGCYRLTAIVNFALDSNRTNDTMTSQFSIIDPALTKNITVDSILYPANNATISPDSTSIPIAVRYMNTGQSNESLVQALTFVRNQDDSIVFSDVKFLAIPSLETRDVIFKNFTPTGFGVFRVYGMSVLSGDTRPSDDTLIHRIFRGYANDVAAVAVTAPASGAQIPEGQQFSLAGSFRWQGGFEGRNNIPVSITIRKCGDTATAYFAQTFIPGLTGSSGKYTQSFPSQNGTMNVKDLPPGCYTATITALLEDDTYRVNDTASTTFTITPTGGVGDEVSSLFTLAQNYPNPASTSTTIAFSLKQAGQVSLRITDITGRTLVASPKQYFTDGEHTMNCNVANLAPGIYLYELTFTANGKTDRLTKTLSIVR